MKFSTNPIVQILWYLHLLSSPVAPGLSKTLLMPPSPGEWFPPRSEGVLSKLAILWEYRQPHLPPASRHMKKQSYLLKTESDSWTVELSGIQETYLFGGWPDAQQALGRTYSSSISYLDPIIFPVSDDSNAHLFNPASSV